MTGFSSISFGFVRFLASGFGEHDGGRFRLVWWRGKTTPGAEKVDPGGVVADLADDERGDAESCGFPSFASGRLRSGSIRCLRTATESRRRMADRSDGDDKGGVRRRIRSIGGGGAGEETKARVSGFFSAFRSRARGRSWAGMLRGPHGGLGRSALGRAKRRWAGVDGLPQWWAGREKKKGEKAQSKIHLKLSFENLLF